MIRWAAGLTIGTLLVGLTSPMFVRSYLPSVVERGVVTAPEGSAMRWRAEGCATTHYGPHGMPGRTDAVASNAGQRWALYGDSQVEGFAVDDADKVFARVEAVSGGRVAAYPLARSGDSLAEWLRQIAFAEDVLGVDRHVFVVVDSSDLTLPDGWTIRDLAPERTGGRLGGLTARVPAFLTQAARHVLTTPDGQPRDLRWRVGPMDAPEPDATPVRDAAFERGFAILGELATRPVTVVYAPPRPMLIDGRILMDPDAAAATLRVTVMRAGFGWIDLSDRFAESVERGVWPFGFANGVIGSGHLNPAGNGIVAEALVGQVVHSRQR